MRAAIRSIGDNAHSLASSSEELSEELEFPVLKVPVTVDAFSATVIPYSSVSILILFIVTVTTTETIITTAMIVIITTVIRMAVL